MLYATSSASALSPSSSSWAKWPKMHSAAACVCLALLPVKTRNLSSLSSTGKRQPAQPKKDYSTKQFRKKNHLSQERIEMQIFTSIDDRHIGRNVSPKILELVSEPAKIKGNICERTDRHRPIGVE